MKLMLCACAAAGVAHRNLRHLIGSKSLTFGTAAPAVAPTGGKSITLGHLTITKGGVPAPAPAPEPAPGPAPGPAPPPRAPAPTSAPATLPRGPPVTGNNDISQVWACNVPHPLAHTQ